MGSLSCLSLILSLHLGKTFLSNIFHYSFILHCSYILYEINLYRYIKYNAYILITQPSNTYHPERLKHTGITSKHTKPLENVIAEQWNYLQRV